MFSHPLTVRAGWGDPGGLPADGWPGGAAPGAEGACRAAGRDGWCW